jgi:hypothetical protein
MLQRHNNSVSAHRAITHPPTAVVTATMNCLPHEAIVHSYFRDATPKNTDDEWIFNAEIPDAQEMSRPLLTDDPRVPENQIRGNWSSGLDHLTAQYQFLREESTFALRRAIGLVREQPHLSEPDHRDASPGIGIYEKVNTNHKILWQNLTAIRHSRQASLFASADWELECASRPSALVSGLTGTPQSD